MLTISPNEALVLTLFDVGAIQFGRFRLHSGKESRIYIDLRVVVSYPHALRQVAAAYRTVLETLTFDLLAATPLAGLPIGTAICLDMNMPLIYPRKTAKSYGTGKNIEGRWSIGQTAVVIDDLITSGDSVLQTIATLKASGLRVTDSVVLIDREQGGRQTLEGQGYQLHSVLTLPGVLDVLVEHQRLTNRQRSDVIATLY
ncbi:MAG: orotate phosphoribosyltransferase [Chloroflexota bacterium]